MSDLRQQFEEVLIKNGFTTAAPILSKFLVECLRTATEQIAERQFRPGTIEIMINVTDPLQ